MIGRGSDFYSSRDCNSLQKAVRYGEISERDGNLIQSYISEMAALHQLSHNRVLKLTTTLVGWKKNELIGPDYDRMTMGDLFTGIQALNTKPNQYGVPYSQNTKQIRTYIRMSQMEQDRVLLRHAGVITDDESKQQERRVTGRVCPNCHSANVPTARYCNRCGQALDSAGMEEMEMYQRIVQNPDVMARLLQALIQRPDK